MVLVQHFKPRAVKTTLLGQMLFGQNLLEQMLQRRNSRDMFSPMKIPLV
jgi:hypothetical protein